MLWETVFSILKKYDSHTIQFCKKGLCNIQPKTENLASDVSKSTQLLGAWLEPAFRTGTLAAGCS